MACINIFPKNLLGFLLVALVSGCQQESPSEQEVAQSSPEEKFQRLYDAFQKTVDTDFVGGGSGFMLNQGGGHSRMVYKNKVSHELFPPADSGDLYRATITVSSQVTYSFRPASKKEALDGQHEKKKAGEIGANPEWSIETGAESLDSDLVTLPERSGEHSPASLPESLIETREDEDVRQYDLVFEDDRWELKTKLDTEIEGAIALAFERALIMQY